MDRSRKPDSPRLKLPDRFRDCARLADRWRKVSMASLHILKGMNEGQRIQLEGERSTLGRNPDCAVVIPITSVSREHAVIVRQAGRFYIEDLQSRNGTFVNNQQINSRTL